VAFANGCSSQKDSTINVADLIPSADFTIEITSCNEDETVDIRLIGVSNADDIISYEWTISNDGQVQVYTTPEVILSGIDPASSLDVQLDIDFMSGCTSSVSRSIDLNDFLPRATYSTSLISCPDENSLTIEFIENSGLEISIINWNINSNGNSTTGSNNSLITQIDRNGITVVNLNVEFANGCSSTLTDTLNINDLLPIPVYSYVVDNCPSEDSVSITISDNTVVDESISSRAWTITFSGTTFTFTNQTFNIVVPRDSTISVSLALVLNNGCVLLLEDEFIVESLPSIEFFNETITACLGDTVKLVLNPNSSYTYLWSSEDGLIFDNQEDKSNPSVIVNEDATYMVTVTDGLCTDSGTVSVSVDTTSNITITGDTITCDGQVELIAIGNKGGGTYQWSLSPDFNEIIAEGDTLRYTIDLREQIFWVRLINSTCNASAVSIEINNSTPELAYFNPFTICRGDTVNFTITNLDPDQVFSYQFEDDSHIISGGDTNSPMLGIGTEEMDSFYLVFNAVNQFGCEVNDSVLVRIVDNPTIGFTAEIEECGEYTVCFEITTDYNGFPLWTFGDPESGRFNNSFSENPCHTYPGPGDYQVTLTTISNYCSATPDTLNITLTEEFLVDDIADQIACEGDTIRLNAGASVDGLNYVWCTPEGDTLSVGPEFIYVADTSDIEVLLKGFDFFGCSDTSSFLIDIFYFNLEFDVPDVICNGEPTEISVNNLTGGNLQYMWGPAGSIISGEDTPNPTISITQDTEITLSIFESEFGCQIDTSILIEASSIEATIAADPGIEINEGEEVVLDVNSGADIVQYDWSDPTLNGNPVTVTPGENTTYTVTVTDVNGCTAIASISISVRQALCNETDVFLPNAFTPNGDGNNDILMVRSNFIEQMELIIYNRWGQEVFRSTNQATGWDGTFNGEQLSPDVFGYRLEVLCINDVTYITKGNVSLLR
jgi:gliding motility-associated-like protein